MFCRDLKEISKNKQEKEKNINKVVAELRHWMKNVTTLSRVATSRLRVATSDTESRHQDSESRHRTQSRDIDYPESRHQLKQAKWKISKSRHSS